MIPIKEGDVVVCSDKSKSLDGRLLAVGTVVMIFNKECFVLDSRGYVHKVPLKEVYLDQGSI